MVFCLFFFTFCQFLCFLISAFDQINVLQWRLNARLRFLLEYVQNINLSSELHGIYGTKGVCLICQRDFKYATTNAFEGFGVLHDQDFTAYGPDPFDPERALPLSELKRRFDALGPALTHTLEKTTAEQLAAPAPFSPTSNPNETVGTLLASIAFHEAYHLGQTGLSRRLLGKPGALLAPGEKGH
jgi:hypothetical protein